MSKTKKAFDSPALRDRSRHYPRRFTGLVPKKVKMIRTVSSDLPGIIKPVMWVYENETYDVWVNRHGAVSAITPDGLLGLKPHEFEVIEWHGMIPNED